ncbi:hypothetical protein HAX54_019357 [Datura stramonium]|uniref:Uncharacterized protein n=1 Tax=Datura stramonium TaxID=4076 RepID=A0ABS8UP01_DATST|nr:hypothetical protein [Datura stramonium]
MSRKEGQSLASLDPCLNLVPGRQMRRSLEVLEDEALSIIWRGTDCKRSWHLIEKRLRLLIPSISTASTDIYSWQKETSS